MNGLLDSLAALWQSYYFSLLGILIAALIVVFLFSKIISGIFWYFRFRERNRNMEQVAKDFGLSFASRLPSLPGFILKSIFRNIEINDLRGSVQNHDIEIRDVFRSLTTFFTVVSPPLPGLAMYFSREATGKPSLRSTGKTRRAASHPSPLQIPTC